MIIGIGGGSCSGKTTIGERLVQELGDQSTRLSFDEYLRRGHHLAQGTDIDWEDPELYREKRFARDLRAIKAGQAVTMRAVSRESKQRGISDLTINPLPYTIVEGFLIYRRKKTVKEFDKTIFLTISPQEMARRKLERTKTADPEALQAYIERKLIPGYERYVLPQAQHAELVLDGSQPIDKLVDYVLGYIMASD